MSTPEIATADEIPRIADAVRAAPLVAVDTEFHAERRYLPELLLVQIHVPEVGTWIVDPLEPGQLQDLAEALTGTPWLVHAGRQDLKLLADALGSVPEVVYDTQIAAGLCSATYPAAFSDLLGEWCAVSAAKAATLSDWSRRPLGPEQLHYAADDVRLLPGLWSRLWGSLEDLGRTELATAACADARDAAIRPVDRDRLWLAVAAAPILDGPGRAVLQELCRWRDEQAEQSDTQPRSILNDGLAVDLARRRPTTVNRILTNRRFPRKLAQRLGDELIALIQRAAGRPEVAWPRVVRPQTEAQRNQDALRLCAEIVGADQQWSARLVFSQERAAAVALQPPADRSAVAQALGPWRDALFGEALWDFVRGQTRIRMTEGAPRVDRVVAPSANPPPG